MNRTLSLASGFFGPRPATALAALERSGPDGRLVQAAARLRERIAVAAPALTAAAIEKAGEEAAAPPAITPEQRLVQRVTLGATVADMARTQKLGYLGYLVEQLDYEKIDDSWLEDILHEHLPTLSMSAGEIYREFPERIDIPILELLIAQVYRAIYSPRQLFETMVVFWTDHFNIDLFGDTGYFLKPVDDRHVIRRYAMDKFSTLLRASAHSPAILDYLTNVTNRKELPNENYARELMELHTLGVDNGYTQEDVRQVARCFTGWTYSWDGERLGEFAFDPEAHDDGEKVVLGKVIQAGGGIQDGEQVLDLLARHPNTALFIARKLLRYFWGYEPPVQYVQQVALTYLRTGGDIRSMLRVILKRKWMETATPKLKRPFHLMVSALRSLFAGVGDPLWLLDQMAQAGHLPFAWSPPNGYPDARGYWSGFLLPRWNFTTAMMDEASSSVALDLSWLNPALPPHVLVKSINAVLANGTLSHETREAIRTYLRTGRRTPERVREAVALALASPELQDF